MKNIMSVLVISMIVSACALAAYHHIIVKRNYISKSEIYVVDTNQLLKDMAALYVSKAISKEEFMRRANIMQDRLVKHDGLVFELGALPGKINNSIQPEFDDLVGKVGK